MQIQFQNFNLIVQPEFVYSPAEDTFFLEDCVKHYYSKEIDSKPENICEMGTGTGYLAIVLKQLFPDAELVALDINPNAVALCSQNLNINNVNGLVIESNLFSYYNNVKKPDSFDLIIFNPPYLPSLSNPEADVTLIDVSLDGGTNGAQVIQRFLQEVIHFLKSNGIIFLILSSFNKPTQILNGYHQFQVIKQYKKRHVFESLILVVLKKHRKNQF